MQWKYSLTFEENGRRMLQTEIWTYLGFVRMVYTRFDDVKTHHRVNIHPHDSQTFFKKADLVKPLQPVDEES